MGGTSATTNSGPMIGEFLIKDLVTGVSGRSHNSSVFGVFGGGKNGSGVNTLLGFNPGVGRSGALASASNSVNSFVLNTVKNPKIPQLANTGNYKGKVKGLPVYDHRTSNLVPLNGVSSRNMSNIWQYRGTYYGFQGNANVAKTTQFKK